MICAILFGLAPTFPLALVVRGVWGFVNGNVGATKTYISEVCNAKTQPMGFSLFIAAFGVATYVVAVGGDWLDWNSAIGPFLGGVLSKPQENLQWLLRLIPGLASVSYVSPCSILDPFRHPLLLWSILSVLCVDQYTVLVAWNTEPWNDQRKLWKEESCESMSREQWVNELEILWRSQAQEGGEPQL